MDGVAQSIHNDMNFRIFASSTDAYALMFLISWADAFGRFPGRLRCPLSGYPRLPCVP